MPQTLKDEVRERIVSAAERVFAMRGYRGAAMAQIAKAAGLSAGNLYRYFPSKDALFESMLGVEFVRHFESLLDRRVAALSRTDLLTLSPEAEATDETLLRFWLEHRLRVVVLLDRAHGSRHEDFGARFVQRLVDLTAAQLEEDRGGPLPKAARFMLTPIFQTSRRAIVAILESHDSEPEIRDAFEAFRRFQLAGLAGFRRWVTQ